MNKNFLQKTKAKLKTLWLMAVLTVSYVAPVYAGTETVTKPLINIKKLLYALIQTGGAIFLGWGVFKLGSAIKAHDSTPIQQALLEIIGGIIMIAVSTVVAYIRS